MYSVYADGVCIYNDAFALDNMKLARVTVPTVCIQLTAL